MMRPEVFLSLSLAALLGAGCAGQPAAPVIDRTGASTPVVVPPVPSAQQASGKSEAVVEVIPLRALQPQAAEPAPAAERPADPAVVSLMNAARQHAHAGRHDRAAASLERALKIEPDNAWLWHRLARTRLDQGRWPDAEDLAVRSNAYARGDKQLNADNWQLIATARKRAGNEAGARLARARAAQYGDAL